VRADAPCRSSSRQWSGKTLADHRYDQQLWLRNLLSVATGIDDPIDAETEAKIAAARAGGAPSPIAWERVRPGDPDLPDMPRRPMRLVAAQIKLREAIAAAKGGSAGRRRFGNRGAAMSDTSSERLMTIDQVAEYTQGKQARRPAAWTTPGG
jgi:hypothetical protein